MKEKRTAYISAFKVLPSELKGIHEISDKKDIKIYRVMQLAVKKMIREFKETGVMPE